MNHSATNKQLPKVAVIVLGYNNLAYLDDCFSSLMKLDYNEYEVYYIDNNSKDGSINFIKSKFPTVKIIVNNKNYGFAKGNNIGIKEAFKNNNDVFMLLNPDTIIDNKCLSNLSKSYEPDIILQPLVLLFDKAKTDRVNTSGNHLQFLGVSYCNELNSARKQIQEKEIASASGAAMYIPKEIIEQVGMLDESFFMYNEDLDFCWRARINGFSIKLIPEAIVWHKYKFSKNARKYFYIEKNRLLFMAKNYQLLTILLILPALIVHEFATLIIAICSGWFIQKIKAYLMFILQLPEVLIKRMHNKRVKNDYELSQYIDAEINFALVSLPGVFIYNKLMGIYWGFVKNILRNLT